MSKKIQSNESYDKMSSSLDTNFDGEIDVEEEMGKEIQQVDELKKSVINMDDYTLEDAQYMEKQIKKSLTGLKYVSDKLEQEIKVGAKPRMFEVYATLANARMNAIKELRELRKIILDIRVKLEAAELGGNKTYKQTNNFMSPKEVRELTRDAKAKSSLKDIDAEFDVGE